MTTNGNTNNLFAEAHDMTVLACATHFLGLMRLQAKEAQKGIAEALEKRELPSQRTPIPQKLVTSILQLPITPQDIANAIDCASNEKDALPFLDQTADFGRDSWASVNKSMLLGDDKVAKSPTWKIVDYSDERSEQELVYAIAIDDVQKRVIVGFRASVTRLDWKHNMNWLYGSTPNPVFGTKDESSFRENKGFGRLSTIRQPEKIAMHRGFRNYIFQKDGQKVVVDETQDDETKKDEECYDKQDDEPWINNQNTKIYHILEKVSKILETKPGYKLYTTGYSLGAGLATIFALFAASSSSTSGGAATKRIQIPTPVTCVTIGSPKCGNLTFRKSFAALENAGKLRYLRIVNENDPIKEAPLKPMTNPWLFWPNVDFRHVGMTLFLNDGNDKQRTKARTTQPQGGYSFYYGRVTNSYCRIVCDDAYKQDLLCLNLFLTLCDYWNRKQSTQEIGDHHGYSEYLYRLGNNRELLEQQTLDGLYRDALFDRTRSVPIRCCPCIRRPKENKNGELRLHYY